MSLTIHPRARAAFDCIAAVLPAAPIGAPRAVREGGSVLVFAGFAGLGAEWPVPPVIEQGLTEAEVEDAAWAEAGAIWRLVTASAAAQRATADALAATAPPAVLQSLGLPESRDAMRARKALRLPARDRADLKTETIYARRRALYEAQRAPGDRHS